jgi:hypothetical protein
VTSYSQVRFGNVKGHKEWITYPDYNGVGNDYTVVLDGTSVPAGSNSDLVVSLWFNTGAGKSLESMLDVSEVVYSFYSYKESYESNLTRKALSQPQILGC